MEDMIVVAYKNEHAAQDNLATLRNLNYDWMLDIKDAVAVARDWDGELHVQDSYKATTDEGAGWGALLGSVLGGLALAPLTGGMSAAAAAGTVAIGAVSGATMGGLTGAAAAADQKEYHGLSEEFVSEVSEKIKRGQSAVFVLVESHDPERVAGFFRGTGGTIIRTNLSPDEQTRVQRILAGNPK